MDAVSPELVAAARSLSERIVATSERRTALHCLQMLHWDGTWSKPAYEPSEEEIARFIDAMRENPRVVPSFDPDDP